MCLFCLSGATSEFAWLTAPVPRVWTGAGGCGLRGRSAVGPVEAECPPPTDTVTVPGTKAASLQQNVEK